MKKSHLRSLLQRLIVLIFFLVGVVLISVVGCKIILSKKSEDWKRNLRINLRTKEKTYKTLTFNPSTRKYSIGTARMVKNIASDKFKSFQKPDGSIVLTSNFGTDEYVCNGNCFCEEEEYRRASTGVLSKGMTYLVAAVTSIVAVKQASNFFQKECEEKFANECPRSSIQSEVEDCVNIIHLSHKEVETNEKVKEVISTEEEMTIQTEPKPGEEIHKYHCEGSCWMRRDVHNYFDKLIISDESPDETDREPDGFFTMLFKKAFRVTKKLVVRKAKKPKKDIQVLDDKFWECDDMKHEGSVDVIVKPEDNAEVKDDRAKIMYIRHQLKSFCMKNSLLQDETEFDQYEEKETISLFFEGEKKYWCGPGLPDFIQCKRIDGGDSENEEVEEI